MSQSPETSEERRSRRVQYYVGGKLERILATKNGANMLMSDASGISFTPYDFLREIQGGTRIGLRLAHHIRNTAKETGRSVHEILDSSIP